MAIDVVMPQMGESVAEGTIVRWIKRVGEVVERDEPLFEISTDKVDAEIPSPAAGVVIEIRAAEGQTVPVDSVVAVIGEAGAAAVPAAQPVPAATTAAHAPAQPSAPSTPAAPPAPALPPEDRLHRRSSPLVRNIAREHHIDISTIRGTGIGGRVTKADILRVIDAGGAERPAAGPDAAHAPARPGTRVPMSVMRKKIAEHMVLSRRTSAHVHSVFEVDFHRVAQVRDARQEAATQAGVKLTYLPFILKAVARALRAVPVINASIDGDDVVYHQDVNVGIAVALDWGLIVPVIKHADEKDLLGLGRAVVDLAGRARSKHLMPDEVAGGTFTVTNPGALGALFGLPIINQPQVAILAVGSIQKRPVVVDDAIAIHPVAHLALGFDHRIIDGAVADLFMAHVKRGLEQWDDAQA